MKRKALSKLAVLFAVCAVSSCAFVPQGSEPYVLVKKWGSRGGGDGEFDAPQGVAVDSSGNVYVADSGNDRIQKFTSEGVFLKKWGTRGSGDGEFDRAFGVAVDPADRGASVYVADTGNHRIQKFRPDLGPSFAVDQLSYGPAGLTVVWVSEPGRPYRIYQSPDLSAWSVRQETVESEGEFTSWTDDAASEIRQRFYKIELDP